MTHCSPSPIDGTRPSSGSRRSSRCATVSMPQNLPPLPSSWTRGQTGVRWLYRLALRTTTSTSQPQSRSQRTFPGPLCWVRFAVRASRLHHHPVGRLLRSVFRCSVRRGLLSEGWFDATGAWPSVSALRLALQEWIAAIDAGDDDDEELVANVAERGRRRLGVRHGGAGRRQGPHARRYPEKERHTRRRPGQRWVRCREKGGAG